MIDIKPTLLRVQPWDALKGTSVYFNFTGSKQFMVNHLVVTDVSNSQIVYSFEFSSFEKVHHLPPREFVNGKIYSAKLRIKYTDGTYSSYSNEIQFRTFETPVLDIVSIDSQGYVYNQDVTFVATYSQGNNEKVRTYRYSLYDENEDLMTIFPVRYPESAVELSELVKGLEKGKGYFIECLVETVNGVIYTHRERFVAMYIVPSVNGLISTVNDDNEGFIRITANLKQIIGTQVKGDSYKEVGLENYDSDNYQYVNDDWIIIPSNKPLLYKGLGMNKASDFVMKIWCKSLPSDKMFMKLNPENGKGISIEFWKHNNRIVARKRINGIESRHCSNIVTIPADAEFMVFAKVIEHRIDISLKIL